MPEEWVKTWFNQDYLSLYGHRENGEAAQQVEFVLNALHLKQGDKILDVGCGNGRHSLALAKKGMSVVGVDSSAFLIGEARNKQSQFPQLDLTFYHAEMKSFKGRDPFDVVLSLFTSFGYYHDDAANLAVLKNLHGNLKNGGQFFLDFLNPDYVKAHFVPYEEKTIHDEEVIIDRKIVGDTVIKNIHFPGRSYQERVKLYSRSDFERLFRQAGFTLTDVWSNYQGAPWSTIGERQLFRCIK